MTTAKEYEEKAAALLAYYLNANTGDGRVEVREIVQYIIRAAVAAMKENGE